MPPKNAFVEAQNRLVLDRFARRRTGQLPTHSGRVRQAGAGQKRTLGRLPVGLEQLADANGRPHRPVLASF